MSIWDTLKTPFNMIDSFLHPERGYEEAQKRIQEAQARSEGFQRPFMEAGTNQIGRLTSAQDALMNPEELQKKWESGYTMSPHAQQLQKEAITSGNNAASSMGLMGSSTALNNVQNSATNIMNADRDAYMKDLMQKYMTGIGIGQNQFNVGAQTAGAMGNQAQSYGEDIAQMDFGKTNAPGDQMGKIMSMIINEMMNKGVGGGGTAGATAAGANAANAGLNWGG